MTVGEAVTVYLEMHLRGRPSYRTIRQVFHQRLLHLKNRDIPSLQRSELLELKRAMTDTPAQWNNAVKALKCAILYCQREGYYEGPNTVQFLKRFHRPSRDRFVQPNEAPGLMQAILASPLRLRVFALLVGCTSARPIEVLRMRWDKFGTWEILGRPWLVWEKGATKNGQPYYKPIPARVADLLLQLPRVSGYVFPGLDPAKHWAPCTYRKHWARLRRLAGVPSDLWVYDLRRTVASWLSMHGENLQTVQHVLDHSSLQSTSVYARLNLETVAGALERHTDRLFAAYNGGTYADHPTSGSTVPVGVCGHGTGAAVPVRSRDATASQSHENDWSAFV